MSRVLASKSLIPVFVGVIALGTGCTFEPPDSVLGQMSPGRDAQDAGATGTADAEPAGGGDDTMTVTFTSEPVGIDERYAPKNIVATWIENAAGTFVKTIDRQAGTRINHLVAWRGMSGANDTDAVTGATRADHNTPVTAIWAIPADLADGTYTIRIETADANAGTADENNQGSFTFDKNGTSLKQENLAIAGYTKVTIDYVASP